MISEGGHISFPFLRVKQPKNKVPKLIYTALLSPFQGVFTLKITLPTKNEIRKDVKGQDKKKKKLFAIFIMANF